MKKIIVLKQIKTIINKILQIKIKNVLTNTKGSAIIYSSKENRRKNEKNKRENHSIHSIYKCYMEGMKLKERYRWFRWESRYHNYQYESVTGIGFPARKTWYIKTVK